MGELVLQVQGRIVCGAGLPHFPDDFQPDAFAVGVKLELEDAQLLATGHGEEAFGIGIDIASGRTVRAVHHGKPVTRHPDPDIDLIGIRMPGWDKILDIAVNCQEMTGLGYLGADLVIDQTIGRLMIEVNARTWSCHPDGKWSGLPSRLDPVVKQQALHPGAGHFEKIEFSRKHFFNMSGADPSGPTGGFRDH